MCFFGGGLWDRPEVGLKDLNELRQVKVCRHLGGSESNYAMPLPDAAMTKITGIRAKCRGGLA